VSAFGPSEATFVCDVPDEAGVEFRRPLLMSRNAFCDLMLHNGIDTDKLDTGLDGNGLFILHEGRAYRIEGEYISESRSYVVKP
jgi:hypothetical protein